MSFARSGGSAWHALWMVLASFLFATMAVGVKSASQSFTTFEVIFYRGLVSVIFMAVVVRARGASLRTPVPMMHLTRSAVGVLSLGSWFYAIAHLPLATAMTLNYMSGVWVAAFILGGALLYGQAQKQGALMGTVMLGFAGVVMTLRPTIDHDQLFAGLIGLLSGIGAALAYMQVTALGKAGEPEERTVFYFSVGTALVGAVGMLFTDRTPWSEVSPQAAAWLSGQDMGQLFRERAQLLAKRPGNETLLEGWDPARNTSTNATMLSMDAPFSWPQLPPAFQQAMAFSGYALDEFKARATRDGASLVILSIESMRMDEPTGLRFKRLKELADPRGIPVIDMYDYMERKKLPLADASFAHDGHWTPAGHAAAAQAVLEYLDAHRDLCVPPVGGS
jgi:S-adenosylmethionine uptake transporter